VRKHRNFWYILITSGFPGAVGLRLGCPILEIRTPLEVVGDEET